MKIIFAGSSAYAIPALEELHASSEYEVVLVLSQPPRPKGRKRRKADTALALWAKQHSLQLFSPEDVNSPESVKCILSYDADVLVTASYGLFIGKSLRQGFPLGAINLHPSLLPRYRGPTPIQTAILQGDTITGNSIFKLVAKMDAGPILSQKQLEIWDGENFSSLHDRLAKQAAELLLELLPNLAQTPEIPQHHDAATYSKLITKEELILDFSQTRTSLLNKIRAFSWEPGAYVFFRGSKLKILAAKSLEEGSDLDPGSISNIIKNEGFTIAASDGQILVQKVQAAGKKIMSAWAYHLGARLKSGEMMGR